MRFLILMLPVIAINVSANFLLKLGAAKPGLPILLNLFSLQSLLGLCCFGLGGLAYAWLLKFVPLGIAQAILASQYVFTVLGARFLLGELINAGQWLGFLLIAIGIAIVLYR